MIGKPPQPAGKSGVGTVSAPAGYVVGLILKVPTVP